MTINAFASWPHFAEHIAAVWSALPIASRGRFMARGQATLNALARLGIEPDAMEHGSGPILVSASSDMRTAQANGYDQVALMEHGSGQSYGGQRNVGSLASYAGGANRTASLFLHPNEHAAGRDRARYPNARVEVVGSPILDTLPAREPGKRPVLAVSFHFDTMVAPETRSAFPWIRKALQAASAHWTILGHGHPRAFDRLAAWYTKVGIEPVRDFRDVCRRADLFMADNTSALFAFATTGRPVVVLNPPWYRRSVDHGLRFWDASTVGVNVDTPANLEAAIALALADGAEQQAAREDALGLVYAHRSGAAQRAAQAVLEWAA